MFHLNLDVSTQIQFGSTRRLIPTHGVGYGGMWGGLPWAPGRRWRRAALIKALQRLLQAGGVELRFRARVLRLSDTKKENHKSHRCPREREGKDYMIISTRLVCRDLWRRLLDAQLPALFSPDLSIATARPNTHQAQTSYILTRYLWLRGRKILILTWQQCVCRRWTPVVSSIGGRWCSIGSEAKSTADPWSRTDNSMTSLSHTASLRQTHTSIFRGTE